MKTFLNKLLNWYPLLKYKAGQHDLICGAVHCGAHFNDDGCTAYEAVCVLIDKLEAAKEFVKKNGGAGSDKLIEFLEKHHDSEDFEFLQMH